MSKENNDKELIKKVVDLYLLHSIEESNFYIRFLGNQLKIYQTHLEYLEDTKPYFFQKKKLEKHNKKIKECEDKINDIYSKMNEEVNEIENTHKILSA